MKYLYTIIILFFTISFSTINVDELETNIKEKVEQYSYNDNYNYVYSLAIIKNTPKTAERYTLLIMSNSYKYNLNPKKFARQIWVESTFKRYAVSSKGALSLGQIIPKHHIHKLESFSKSNEKLYKDMVWGKHKSGYKDSMRYDIYNLACKKTLTPSEKSNFIKLQTIRDDYVKYIYKYFYIPEYNIEISAIIMRKLLDNNTERKSFYIYNAGGNRKYKISSAYSYADTIICGDDLHKDLELYHNWKIVSIK